MIDLNDMTQLLWRMEHTGEEWRQGAQRGWVHCPDRRDGDFGPMAVSVVVVQGVSWESELSGLLIPWMRERERKEDVKAWAYG